MIQLTKISKHYMNGNKVVTAIDNVSMRCGVGDFVVVSGASGSGKSTLLNILSGTDYATSGEYFVGGIDTDSFDLDDWRNFRCYNIGLIYQDFKLIDTYTAEENIALAVSLFYRNNDDIKQETRRLIEQVGIEEFAHKPTYLLSGGQKQRVAIARALAGNRQILLADEPTANLDPENAEDIVSVLKELAKNRLIIVVTHNEQLFESVCTRKIVLSDGKIIFDGENKKKSEDKFDNIFSNNELSKRNNFYGLTKHVVPLFKVLLSLLLVIFCCLGIYSFCLNNISGYSEGVIGSEYFQNLSSERYVITKNDSSSFTEQDYENIKKRYTIKYIVTEDLALDTIVYIPSPNIHTNLAFYLLPMSMLEDDITIGRPSEKEDEVVILGGNGTPLYGMESSEEYFELNADGFLNFGIQIVGWGADSYHYQSSIYVSEEMFMQFYMEAFGRYAEIRFARDDAPNVEGVLFDKEVPSNTVLFLGEQISLKNKESVIFETNQNTLLLKELKVENINLYSKLQNRYKEFNNYILLNYEDYENLLAENHYQISVFSEDYIESWDNYNVIYPYSINKLDAKSDDILQKAFWFMFCLILSIVLLLIASMFLCRVIYGEIENAYVRILLGFTEGNVYRFFFVRLISVIILAFIMILLLYGACIYISKMDIFVNDFVIISNIPAEHLVIMSIFACMFLFIYLLNFVLKKLNNLLNYGG